MSLTALKALALAKKYTKDTIEGAGAVAGKPCQIQSITDITGGKRVTFLWVDNSDVEHTSTMDVKDGEDGKGIKTVTVNANNHLVITYTDDTTYDAGEVKITAKVNSVNGKTGDVTLSTSDLNNDSDFVSDSNYVHTDNNYNNAAKALVDGITAALAEKADADDVIDGASYDSTNHLILFKNGTTTLFSLDAAAFVKDGMVDDVEIVDGNLVITFNTDAGKQAISIPLTDIFDPANYYDKDDVDGLLADKADQTEVNSIENYYGSKNLCVYPFFHTTRTVNGITFTDNGDGTVTATGTATDNAIFNVSNRLEIGKLILPNGEYKVNGCPSGGSTNSYWMIMSRTSGGTSDNYGNDTGNGMTATLNGDDFSQDNVHFQIAIVIKSGYEITTPLVFKPMVRLATIKDDMFAPYAKTNHELTVDKAEQSEVDGISNTYGAKNLLRFPYSYGTKTIAGITFTVNDDGTIVANGTATENAIFRCSIRREGANAGDFILPNGDYILSGCTGGSRVSPYDYDLRIVVTKDGQAVATVNYDGDTPFTIDGDDASATDAGPTVQIIIRSGITVTNLVFKPMIRLASVKDNTYVPYVPTNAKLNEEKMSYADNGVLGAKNLNKYPYVDTTKTSNGVTFTDNGDGTITANGTATADAVLNCHTRIIGTTNPLFISNGEYVISGCPSGGSSSTYMVGTAITKNGSGFVLALDYGDGKEFTLNGDDTYTDKAQLQIQIIVKNGTTVNNLIFKPMLRLASDSDNTYQPYAMTNKELTDRVIQSVESITLDSTTTNAGSVRLYRYGNLRVLTGYFKPTVAGTSDANTHIADLPLATDLPAYHAFSICGRGETDSSSTAKIGNLNIGTDGTIKYQGQATGENMFFNITWVVTQ